MGSEKGGEPGRAGGGWEVTKEAVAQGLSGIRVYNA